MEDIARLAGVSRATVSRALAGSKLISEQTRIRVVELARSLNYSINVGAQNLRLKHNRTVAVVVPFDPTTRQHLSEPFFLSLIGSIADALTERGYDMLLSRVDAGRLDLAARAYETGRAMGIILIGQWHDHDRLNEMAVRGVPFVVWGALMSQQMYCTVGSDNVQGGELATQHLLDCGARRIVFLGDPSWPEVGQRYEGYLRAHRARRLEPVPELCLRTPFVSEVIRNDVEALVASDIPFDGIFASSDITAMTAVSTLRRLGRRCPEDVAVVGYDDIELASHFHPALSTVRQPISLAGQALVESLLEQADTGKRAAPRQLVTELVVRDSSVQAAAPAAQARKRSAPLAR